MFANETELQAEFAFDAVYAEALKENVEFDEREASCRRWRETQEKERRARVEQRRPYLAKIADRVVMRGHKAELNVDLEDCNDTFTVDGVRIIDVSVEYHQSRMYGYRREGPKTLRICVDRQPYPQKKDGTFSWDKIADAVIAIATARNARDKKDAQYRGSSLIAQSLKAELGLKDYSGAIRGYEHSADKVVFRVGDLTVTPETARKLFAALKELGLEPKY